MTKFKNATLLRPYQRRWANDPSRFALAVKAAQIGFSTATAPRHVEKCLRRPRHLVVFLSRSEGQSLELAEKAKSWVGGYQGVVAEYFPGVRFGGSSILQHEIRFANKSRIIALAANPDTARGYTGDVFLDEFAFHRMGSGANSANWRRGWGSRLGSGRGNNPFGSRPGKTKIQNLKSVVRALGGYLPGGGGGRPHRRRDDQGRM